MLRRHALFAVVMCVGGVLRLLAWLAYQPALFYPDSSDYLNNTFRIPKVGWHPPAYSLFLDLFTAGHHLAIVTAAQHVLVLADGVAIYLLLLRLRSPRWLAAIAVAPLVLDAYQIQIEQYILSEALFETLLTAMICVCLWPSATAQEPAGRLSVGPLRAAVAGFLLGLAVLTRIDAIALVVPLLIWLVWSQRRAARGSGDAVDRVARRGRVLIPCAAAVAALAVPLAALMALNATQGGGAALNGIGPEVLYGRIAGFADCAHDDIPPAWRPLCPTQPIGHRPSPDWFESNHHSPFRQWQRTHHKQETVARAFAIRVIEHQPIDYLHLVLAEFADQFRPTRTTFGDSTTVQSWRFRLTLKPVDPTKPVPARMVARYGHGKARLNLPLARVLHDYQRFGYLPGPIVAALLVLCIVALVRRRRHPLAPAIFLLAGMGVATVLFPVATVLFSWRYILPTLFMYPPAAALAWMALREREPRAPGEENQGAQGDGLKRILRLSGRATQSADPALGGPH